LNWLRERWSALVCAGARGRLAGAPSSGGAEPRQGRPRREPAGEPGLLVSALSAPTPGSPCMGFRGGRRRQESCSGHGVSLCGFRKSDPASAGGNRATAKESLPGGVEGSCGRVEAQSRADGRVPDSTSIASTAGPPGSSSRPPPRAPSSGVHPRPRSSSGPLPAPPLLTAGEA
jgi:hypothetical protein